MVLIMYMKLLPRWNIHFEKVVNVASWDRKYMYLASLEMKPHTYTNTYYTKRPSRQSFGVKSDNLFFKF